VELDAATILARTGLAGELRLPAARPAYPAAHACTKGTTARPDVAATREGLATLTLIRRQELDGFVEGLFGASDVVGVYIENFPSMVSPAMQRRSA
jgi:hypothetical protein